MAAVMRPVSAVVAAAATRVHFLRDGAVAASVETQHDPALVSHRYLETYQ